MELARFRHLCRTVFFVGATMIFFGVGAYALGWQTVGILLLTVGLVVAIMSFSFIRMFMMYDMMHMVDRRRKADDSEYSEGRSR